MTEEQRLRQLLATLHRNYLDEARPYLERLAALEALKPPQPIIVHVDQLPPALRERLRQQLGIRAGVALEKHEEDANARILRLEQLNTRLMRLLRLVDGAAPGGILPDYLHEQIKAARRDMGE